MAYVVKYDNIARPTCLFECNNYNLLILPWVHLCGCSNLIILVLLDKEEEEEFREGIMKLDLASVRSI